MNCDWVQENITLYLYNELADDARHEVEQHAARCKDCAAELAAQREFHGAMNTLPVIEPTASFLAAARIRLQDALEHAEQHRAWYQRFTFDPAAWLRQVRFSPALATVIFLVGFGGGLGTMYKTTHNGGTPQVTGQSQTSQAPTEASISGITSIDKEPNSDTIQVHYDRLTADSLKGSVSDPKVLELLLYACKSNENPGVRLNSVEALANKVDDPRVRETLTYSLRFDSNPGVRLRALEALGPSVKDDIRVRNAVLDSLLNDSNPGVRAGALRSLQPVSSDSSVRMALQQLAKEDPNDYIRTESKQLLASAPVVY